MRSKRAVWFISLQKFTNLLFCFRSVNFWLSFINPEKISWIKPHFLWNSCVFKFYIYPSFKTQKCGKAHTCIHTQLVRGTSHKLGWHSPKKLRFPAHGCPKWPKYQSHLETNSCTPHPQKKPPLPERKFIGTFQALIFRVFSCWFQKGYSMPSKLPKLRKCSGKHWNFREQTR